MTLNINSFTKLGKFRWKYNDIATSMGLSVFKMLSPHDTCHIEFEDSAGYYHTSQLIHTRRGDFIETKKIGFMHVNTDEETHKKEFHLLSDCVINNHNQTYIYDEL
jgi:hypothetical protein